MFGLSKEERELRKRGLVKTKDKNGNIIYIEKSQDETKTEKVDNIIFVIEILDVILEVFEIIFTIIGGTFKVIAGILDFIGDLF